MKPSFKTKVLHTYYSLRSTPGHRGGRLHAGIFPRRVAARVVHGRASWQSSVVCTTPDRSIWRSDYL